LHSADPHTVDISDLKDQMNTADPSKVSMLIQMQTNFSQGELTDAPLEVAHLFRNLYDPADGDHYTTMADAAALLSLGHISRETYSTLTNAIKARDDNNASGVSDPLKTFGIKQMQSMFESEYGADPGDEVRQRSAEAVDEFVHQYLLYRASPEGKKANEDQVRTWINNKRAEIAPHFLIEPETFKQVPRARIEGEPAPGKPAGPQPVDPAKQPVADAQTIRRIAAEFAEKQAGRRAGYSAQTISILRRYIAAPDSASVQTFITQQLKLIH